MSWPVTVPRTRHDPSIDLPASVIDASLSIISRQQTSSRHGTEAGHDHVESPRWTR